MNPESANDGAAIRERLIEVARSLELYAAPATLTDSCNRLLHVNNAYAQAIGDPNRDSLDANSRFVMAALLGPYRACFPRIEQEVASCFPVLVEQVDRGRLGSRAGVLAAQVLHDYPAVRRGIDSAPPWKGVVLLRTRGGRQAEVAEQVIPVADHRGRPSRFYVNVWVETGGPTLDHVAAPDVMALTARQRQLARLVVGGLSAREIARRLQLSHHTVRGHLEEIHVRLDVHSRAELTALLVREGIA